MTPSKRQTADGHPAVAADAGVQMFARLNPAAIPHDAVGDRPLDDRTVPHNAASSVGQKIGPQIVRRRTGVDDVAPSLNELDLPRRVGRAPHWS